MAELEQALMQWSQGRPDCADVHPGESLDQAAGAISWDATTLRTERRVSDLGERGVIAPPSFEASEPGMQSCDVVALRRARSRRSTRLALAGVLALGVLGAVLVKVNVERATSAPGVAIAERPAAPERLRATPKLARAEAAASTVTAPTRVDVLGTDAPTFAPTEQSATIPARPVHRATEAELGLKVPY
jgi:hypothetical protein